MSVILISSDSDVTGKEIADSVAEKLGYKVVNREILGGVARKYTVQEEKLSQSLDECSSFIRIPSKLWNRYLSYIQEATLGELIKDNIVCYGLAAHLYVLGVSHVLRLRILSDPGNITLQAVSAERSQDRKDSSSKKAVKLMKQKKKHQRRWSMEAFGLDETDPSQYDLVINLSKIDQEEAINIIMETISYRRFTPMTYSIKRIQDIELASRVRAALIEQVPDVRVRSDSGTVVIETTALTREKNKRSDLIKGIAGKIQGVEYVEVHVINDIFRQAVESFR